MIIYIVLEFIVIDDVKLFIIYELSASLCIPLHATAQNGVYFSSNFIVHDEVRQAYKDL